MTAARETLVILAAFVVGGVAVGLALYVRRRRRAAEAIGDRHLLLSIVGSDLFIRPWMRLGVILFAASSIAGGLLDPGLLAPASAPRGPVVLLLDVSGSMLAQDGGSSRIERERELARALVAAIPDVPIGIVAFSGSAFSLPPPTRDRRAIEMYLENLDPTIVTQSGSGLGAALRQGIGLLTADTDSGGGSLLLLTDGDETENREEAVAAAELAGRERIAVHVLGIGSELGAPVPALDLASGVTRGFLRDEAGEVVVSRLDPGLLAEIATRGHGVFATADAANAVNSLATEFIEGPRVPAAPGRIPLYAWLAAAAFILLLGEPLTHPRATPR